VSKRLSEIIYILQFTLVSKSGLIYLVFCSVFFAFTVFLNFYFAKTVAMRV